jgi:hypothetical protein
MSTRSAAPSAPILEPFLKSSQILRRQAHLGHTPSHPRAEMVAHFLHLLGRQDLLHLLAPLPKAAASLRSGHRQNLRFLFFADSYLVEYFSELLG